jgi:hypothetical protein
LATMACHHGKQFEQLISTEANEAAQTRSTSLDQLN